MTLQDARVIELGFIPNAHRGHWELPNPTGALWDWAALIAKQGQLMPQQQPAALDNKMQA